MYKIAIAEDVPYILENLLEKLSFFDNFDCIVTASNGQELLEKLKLSEPVDLVLMDIEMPLMNGIETTKNVKQLYPSVRILMNTVFDNDESIFESIKAGADGYLLKDIAPDELHRSIVDTLNGGAVMTPSIALKTLKLLRTLDSPKTNENHENFNLSTREIEVIQELSTGQKYFVIADHLNISEGTVRKHIENIYAKLHVCNKVEAIAKAQKNKLI